MTRWATIPALAGHAPADIIDICGHPDLDQNPLVAALIRLHQQGDPDATTVLMAALRPMVLASAAKRGHFTDETLDNDWAAVAHTLGTIDPDREPTDSAGQPEVFLAHLGKRLGLSRRRLDPAAQRWLVRRQRGTGPTLLLVQPDSSTIEVETQRSTTTDTCVEDEALARVELDRIAGVVAAGQIPRSRWDQLVAHRIDQHPRKVASGRTRVAVHRTAHRLAHLVDHAA